MADASIARARVARELDAVIRLYGTPKTIVSDDGPELAVRRSSDGRPRRMSSGVASRPASRHGVRWLRTSTGGCAMGCRTRRSSTTSSMLDGPRHPRALATRPRSCAPTPVARRTNAGPGTKRCRTGRRIQDARVALAYRLSGPRTSVVIEGAEGHRSEPTIDKAVHGKENTAFSRGELEGQVRTTGLPAWVFPCRSISIPEEHS